jgi:alanine-glyoxylate transaminase/serine-glyoxylate transaminase/serine-pyruvate transaminase
MRQVSLQFRLEVFCREPRHYSGSLTAVLVPNGYRADNLRAAIVDALDLALASGLSKTASRVFRIGQLGDFNDRMPAGTLSGVEMGLELAGVPRRKRSVQAAIDYLADAASVEGARAAAE